MPWAREKRTRLQKSNKVKKNTPRKNAYAVSGVIMPLLISAVETDDTWQW